MASKKALLGGATVKVENMSGFDKSRYHGFTAPLGAIVPMLKQLCIPGKVKVSLKVSASLPPLATDAFLRTHLKVEAFYCPLRLCYGGFQSWFSGEQVCTTQHNILGRAKLPRLVIPSSVINAVNAATSESPLSAAYQAYLDAVFGPHSLLDYFGVKVGLENGHVKADSTRPLPRTAFNIFPTICYNLIYHHWYRNKLVERPLFAPNTVDASGVVEPGSLSHLPWCNYKDIHDFGIPSGNLDEPLANDLLNGNSVELRQRNYGFDYFTTALPSAQDGNPMTVDTSGGSFTISALRAANAGQHFGEINQLAGPDYIAVNRSRYNRAPSSLVAGKPVLLGSADFPMFTSGVEQQAQGDGSGSTANPFAGIAARYGRAHAEGSDFVCECDVDEPGYLFVMCSLVPEANYAEGIAKDMTIFTEEGSLSDLPVSALERIGLEPVYEDELVSINPNQDGSRDVFGYQPRYMWHKAGSPNMVSGLFREGASLESFIPQRKFDYNRILRISTDFLKVKPTDLDNVMAVSGDLSKYGVMIDSAINVFVSEPLGESALPSLVDPGAEHGSSVYLKRGGVSVND